MNKASTVTDVRGAACDKGKPYTPINYSKGGDEVREAYVKWRKTHKYATHNVASFVAGFNAARA